MPGTSGRTPLLLHGTGGDEHDLIPLGRELDPAALISPRGKVLENGHPRFFRRLAERVFDQEDLKMRTEELADFVSAATAYHEINPNKLVEVGYSNGANIAASILLRRAGVLARAVLLRAMIPFAPETLPDLSGTRIWIGGGQQDTIILPGDTQQLADLLEQAGAQVTAHFTHAGHGLTNIELVLVQRWLAR